jgi:hypothetical protein
MAVTLKFAPGSTIRWGAKRFVVVDYADMDPSSPENLANGDLTASRSRMLHQIGLQATGLRGHPIWYPYRKRLGKQP